MFPSLLPYFRAKGLQSIVQLMGEKDLYDYWSDTYKIHSLDWSRQKAADILAEWQGRKKGATGFQNIRS